MVDSPEEELGNFERVIRCIQPDFGEIPSLRGVDIYGGILPYNGVFGGDHIVYVDFKKRYSLDRLAEKARVSGNQGLERTILQNKKRAGILLVDVAGHQLTDAVTAAMLHQAFLTGALYEMQKNGEITASLFENLNTRFFNSTNITKLLTLLYGEISEEGTFRFLSAGHPEPVIFSNRYDRFMDLSSSQIASCSPIGLQPSEWDCTSIPEFTSKTILGRKGRYPVNQLQLMGGGDILLLHTDGFIDHMGGEYYPNHATRIFEEIKEQSAERIFEELKADMLKKADLSDDTSLVVIKKTT